MKPPREPTRQSASTYFVTAQTSERKYLFRNQRWADLFLKTLFHYQGEGYLLHEFVLMPDHFHLLITPEASLERAIQLIKGGFSYRAGRELNSKQEIWQRGFSDHRIRDQEDFNTRRSYIHLNPVRAGLCARPEDFQYGSARGGFDLDAFPQGLKPRALGAVDGTAEAVPLQGQPVARLDGAAAPSEVAESCPSRGGGC